MSRRRLREAVAADIPALQDIEHQCFVTDRIKPRQMRYLLSKAKALNLVAETSGEVLAYSCCLTPAAMNRPARLYSLAVRPEQQGQGLARALLRRLVKLLRVRGYERLRLEVRATDERTLALYQRLGFRTLRRIDNYYEDGETALRLELKL
ncbi:MAG: GNAT family N-acetyltransferase [Congregibacter sp.]|nr:GNAT family N-acetyltransferase [Congregibacter sp.]MDP5069740.1 GNAT family N-acetyltransferase [Congregibacter sp.]